MAVGWRFIAVGALDGEILDWEVPLTLSSNPRRDLSGPGAMNGTIEPEYSRLRGPDGRPIIQEWGTKLFLEVAGHLRWGGIVTKTAYDGPKASIQCEGLSAYAHGTPYDGHMISGALITPPDPYAGKDKNHDGYIDGSKPKQKVPPPPKPYTGPRIDTYDAFRNIWDRIQNRPYGNIGLRIDSHHLGHVLGAKNGSDPWELAWWNNPDCGQAIDQLARDIPFDWIETHAWAGSGNAIDSRIVLGKPRIGRKRDDLRFADGENISAIARPEGMGDEYANELRILGKGEGRKMARHQVHRYERGRLRRVATVTDKSLTGVVALRSRATRELLGRTGVLQIPLIQVINHPNAKFGSWQLGDDIRVQVDLPWVGKIDVWHRIVSEEISADDTCLLGLRRSDSFVY
ncbi:hypothetical protein [Streptomyces sp. NPDC047315]|uniref:hypothetical protein n=1 Tax=Streptomyces sp. NPDC047315 TaxID=3155142 RepID=UPI0033E4890B